MLPPFLLERHITGDYFHNICVIADLLLKIIYFDAHKNTPSLILTIFYIPYSVQKSSFFTKTSYSNKIGLPKMDSP